MYQEEDSNPALELAESLADSLMDHFTERGLLAKEIKVAEIVEVEGDGDAWDASEESLYSLYGTKFRSHTENCLSPKIFLIRFRYIILRNPNFKFFS